MQCKCSYHIDIGLNGVTLNCARELDGRGGGLKVSVNSRSHNTVKQ